MADSPENDPVFWRAKAEEARSTAENLINPQARDHMLSAARSYEPLAELAEQTMGLKQKKQGGATEAA